MKLFSKIMLCIMLVVVVAGCQGIGGNGQMSEETRDVGAFQRIALSNSAIVNIQAGDAVAVVITAESNLLPHLLSDVNNGTLQVGTRPNTMLNPTQPIVYDVTVTELEALSISGSGTINVMGLTTEALVLNSSGSGIIRVEALQAQTIAVDSTGSGSIIMKGDTNDIDISISGSGDVDTNELTARLAQVDISGSGQATVNAQETLNISISGSGSVEYSGTPALETSISGSGTVRPINN